MRRLLAILLSVVLILAISPLNVLAVEWTDPPTITISKTDLNNLGEMSVTVSVGSSQKVIQAYSFALSYDSTLFSPDTEKGTITKYNNETEEYDKVGLTAPKDNGTLTFNSALAVNDKTAFGAFYAGSEAGVGKSGFSVTFYFKLKNTAISSGVGGIGAFDILTGTATVNGTNKALFKLGDSQNNVLNEPVAPLSTSVSIPISKADLSGSLTTPEKNVQDASNITSTNTNVDVNVSWSPALVDGKFAANTEYRATVTVSPKNGLSFAADATITPPEGSGLSFAKSGSNFVATKTFQKTEDKTLTDITAHTTNTNYTDGDELSGLTVTATYDDNSSSVITSGYTVVYNDANYGKLKKGDTEAKVTYGGKEATVSGLTVSGKQAAASDFVTSAVNVTYDGTDKKNAISNAITHSSITGVVTYSFEPDNVINAGEYIVKANVSNDPHYADATNIVLGKVTVQKKSITPTIDGIQAVTYNGGAQTPAVTVKDGNTTLTTDDYSVTYSNNIDAGTNTAVATIKPKDGSNYTFNETTKNFTINPKDVTVNWTDTSLQYNGNPQKPAASATGVTGETINLNVSGQQTDVGTYQASATIASVTGGQGKASNYSLTNPTINYSITKSDYSGTLTASLTVPANKESSKEVTVSNLPLPAGFKNASITRAEIGTNTDQLLNTASASNGMATITTNSRPKDNTGTVTLTVSSDNYNDATVTLTVTAQAIIYNFDGVTAKNGTYGDKNSALVTLPNSPQAKDASGNTLNGTLTVKDQDVIQEAGDQTVTVVFTVNEPNSDYNGIKLERDVTVHIDKKSVTVTGITASNKTYDGDVNATLDATDASISGVLDSDKTNVAVSVGNGAGTFDNANVGTGKTVNIDLTKLALIGTKADNYSLDNTNSQQTATADITAIEVTVTGITANNKTYDGTTAAELVYTGASINGVLQADQEKVNVASATGVFDNANAGTGKTVTISNITLGGEKATNYIVKSDGTQISTTANIEKKSLTAQSISVEPVGNQIYDNGNEIKPTVTVKDGDRTLPISEYSLSYEKNKEVGQATITITAATTGNYKDSTTAKFTIDPKPITGNLVITTNVAENEKVTTGTVLTADVSGLTPNEDVYYTYQWYRGGTQIENESTKTYTVTDDDADETLKVIATATDKNYTGSKDASITVGKITFTATVQVAPDDTEKPSKLTATVTTTAPADNYDIEWMRDGTQISGATGTEYQVGDADKGHSITAKAVAKGDYTGEVTSDPVAIPAEAPKFTKDPTVTNGDKTVAVSWDTQELGSPITSYVITVEDSDGNKTTYTAEADATNYRISNLTNGKTYKITVTAKSAAGDTTSAEVTATPKETSSGGNGGGAEYNPSYMPKTKKAENGTITVTPQLAREGAEVTITVKPDDGYELDQLKVTDSKGRNVNVVGEDNVYAFKMPRGGATVEATFKPKSVEPGPEPGPGPEPTPSYKDGYKDCDKGKDCPFKDYDDLKGKTDAWYHDGVHFCLENGIMNGMGNGLFQPEETTTRAQVLQMLWKLEGKPESSIKLDFTDTPAEWYQSAIKWGVENKIVEGYGDGTFHPDDPVTREQLAKIMYGYAALKGMDVSAGENTNILSYPDAGNVSGWAVKYVQWAVGVGLINGRAENGETYLAPQGSTKRCEVATIIMRFCTG